MRFTDFSKRFPTTIRIAMIVFSFALAIGCGAMSKRSINLQKPIAKMGSLFRADNPTPGKFRSRFCDRGKKRCKKPEHFSYYELNACDPGVWREIRAGRMVLVPITEL